jgi:hypothetical protein
VNGPMAYDWCDSSLLAVADNDAYQKCRWSPALGEAAWTSSERGPRVWRWYERCSMQASDSEAMGGRSQNALRARPMAS